MRGIALGFAVMTCAAVVTGCQTINPQALNLDATNPGAATNASYSAGRSVQSFAIPVTTVQPAALAAMDDLRISIIRQTNDGGAIVIEGKTADDRRASVGIRPTHEGSRVIARFGLFGDEALSRAFMDRLGVRVGTLAPAPIPTETPASDDRPSFLSNHRSPDAEFIRDQAEAPYRGTAVP